MWGTCRASISWHVANNRPETTTRAHFPADMKITSATNIINSITIFGCKFITFTQLIDAICVSSIYRMLTKSQWNGTAKCFVIASYPHRMLRDQADVAIQRVTSQQVYLCLHIMAEAMTLAISFKFNYLFERE